MAATAQLHSIAQKTCGKLFEFYSEFLVAGTYHRGDAASATVDFLIAPVPANLLVGDNVEPNDEQIFIDADDMSALVNPQPGDYLIETASGLRREVITAHLDMTQTMWTLLARKVFK
jgi:hypothetical protein